MSTLQVLQDELEKSNKEFIKKISNNNSIKKRDSCNMIIGVELYNNGYKVKYKYDKKMQEKYFSFNNIENIKNFNKIKQGTFPLSLIPLTTSSSLTDYKLCLVFEDYSKEDYFFVDENLETTNITIQLITGKTLSHKFNVTHTIEDIKNFIAKNDTLLYKRNYTFIHGYPRKIIEPCKGDDQRTITELNLENATLIQVPIQDTKA